jgi:hypothetical protein
MKLGDFKKMINNLDGVSDDMEVLIMWHDADEGGSQNRNAEKPEIMETDKHGNPVEYAYNGKPYQNPVSKAIVFDVR